MTACVCVDRCFSVVAQLVEHEMDTLKDEDDDSNTPLHLACISGRLGVAEVLIEANAKLDARCNTVLIIRILVWSDKCQSKQEVGWSSADIDQTL